MATYTKISHEALERFLIMFEIGELKSFDPIADGIENSNYFVYFEDSNDEFVLTITEGLEFEDVPFFNDLLQNLASARVAVPEPQRTLDGMVSTIFKGKPTWLFSRLPGSHIGTPTIEQCREIGTVLAKIHSASSKCRYTRDNYYNAKWALQSLQTVEMDLSSDDRRHLDNIITQYSNVDALDRKLPKGIIHGDLFRDNALFIGEALTGVIDFYHACDDYLIQDVAITVNDWCMVNGRLDNQKLDALLGGYNLIRPLEAEEISALNEFRQYAAMRFALTRLLGGRSDNPVKNPKEFLTLLASLSS